MSKFWDLQGQAMLLFMQVYKPKPGNHQWQTLWHSLLYISNWRSTCQFYFKNISQFPLFISFIIVIFPVQSIIFWLDYWKSIPPGLTFFPFCPALIHFSHCNPSGLLKIPICSLPWSWLKPFHGFLLRSRNWQLQNTHGDVKYCVGNIVNDIVITMYGARWVFEILGGSLCKVYDCFTTMLYTWN